MLLRLLHVCLESDCALLAVELYREGAHQGHPEVVGRSLGSCGSRAAQPNRATSSASQRRGIHLRLVEVSVHKMRRQVSICKKVYRFPSVAKLNLNLLATLSPAVLTSLLRADVHSALR